MTGYAFCGSFCTLSASLSALRELTAYAGEILPIVSNNVYETDTRFFLASDFLRELESICKNPIIHTIVEAEPIGPSRILDALVIAPCTGNTLSKIANGITDTPVTMAAKAHLRADRPLLIALASNDAMSANLKNIAAMLQRKNVYFVPMKQDDPKNKPHSLVCDFKKLLDSYINMKNGKQSRPLFI